jgi:DNA-binding response OmpR family regulator
MLALKETIHPARPSLILAHADPLYTALIRQIFLRLGWDVYTVASGIEVRELAAELSPSLVILDAELPEESGWLTCAKLKQEQPDLKVVLLVDQVNLSSHAFGYFAGASALVLRDDGLHALVEEARDVALSAAG